MSIKVGLQMYTVREYMRFAPLDTLQKISEIGYKYVELPNHNAQADASLYYGKTAQEWKNQAEQSEVSITGAYVTGLTLENIHDICKFYHFLGSARIVIPIDYFPNRQILDRKCELYNQLGQVCSEYGLTLYYENHYHEFQKLEDKIIMDVLMEQTDSSLFCLSLNTYWLMRGLVEPLDFYKKYASRIGSIVQEDFPLNQIDKFNMWNFQNHHPIAKNIQYNSVLKGNEIENIHPVQCELFTEIGNGILKLQPIINLANESGKVSYVFLKQDFTEKPSEFESAAISLENYRKVSGVSFS